MNPESKHEEMNETGNEEDKAEIEPIKWRDTHGRLEWLSKAKEKRATEGMKLSNNARLNLEFYRDDLERILFRRFSGPKEKENGLHLLKMLEGIAEDFANLELTNAQKKLMRQVVDELERRALDDRNEEDPHLREDMNARVMQLYTFLKTIESSQR